MLRGRQKRHCMMVVFLNKCDPVLGGSVLPRGMSSIL